MRQDKRSNSSIRKLKITKDFMKFAEGSCLFEIGDTKIVCTASIEEGVPKFLKDKATGWVTAEYSMLPRSCKTRIMREASRGKLGGRTQEIQRLIGRSMRAVTDMTKFPEKTIWMDCDVIQADGGTRCASITGSFIALIFALEKLKKDKIIDEIPVSDYLAAVSVGILDGEEVLDLAYDEDSKASVDMNVVMTQKGKFIEIQGTAEKEPFAASQMNSMLSLAKKGINKLIKAEKEIFSKSLSL
jgi:ribonuclease PH